jgi:hypothetical protein
VKRIIQRIIQKGELLGMWRIFAIYWWNCSTFESHNSIGFSIICQAMMQEKCLLGSWASRPS